MGGKMKEKETSTIPIISKFGVFFQIFFKERIID